MSPADTLATGAVVAGVLWSFLVSCGFACAIVGAFALLVRWRRLICRLLGHRRWVGDAPTLWNWEPDVVSTVAPDGLPRYERRLPFTRSWRCWRCGDWIHEPKHRDVPPYRGRTYAIGWPYRPHAFVAEGSVELNDFGDQNGMFYRALHRDA